MRKLLFLVASTFITGSLLAGGLVSNNNQSAMFTRLQNRNASTSIDAAYYNPAGLTRLGNGFFAGINNQTVTQTQKVVSNFPGTPKEYVGDVFAPLFPGVYLAYNTGNFSFSAGMNPVGGGGSAKYEDGLPSFEMMVAGIPQLLTSKGIPTSEYSADIYFEGKSVYLGYQANVAYKISDQLSLGAGFRMVTAKNTYKGSIRNIMVNPMAPPLGFNGSMVLASDFFTTGAANLNTAATGLNQLSAGSVVVATGLTNAINGGLSPATPLSAMPAQTQAAVAQLLGPANINTAGMNVGTAAATLNAVAPQYAATAQDLKSKADELAPYAAQTADKIVDASQTGTGFTPILSANYSPNEKFDFSMRYEFKTKLTLKTSVAEGMGAGFFTNGEETIADMPAELSLGVNYRPISNLTISAAFDEYFDKNVDYDGSDELEIDMIDKNFMQYGLGVEYGFTEKLRISTGWSHTATGVNENYQRDREFDVNTNSFGAGFGYRISPMIDLNIGGQYTLYSEDSKVYSYPPFPNAVTDTYDKSTWIIAAGLDFYFGKK